MFKRQTLENGLRVVCEEIPYVRSVALGIWIGTGSRSENLLNNGISHFIEHMLFKGTTNRTAKELADSIDNIGGQINAFTGKECTCYYTKTLDSHMEIAMDVLADMVFNSKISPKDIDTERKVIIEEINMYEDSPEEMVHDILSETVWKGDPLSYPILGTLECLNGIKREDILDYMNTYYTPSNCVISVAGNFQYDKLIDLVQKYFGEWKGTHNPPVFTIPGFTNQVTVKEKDTEQIHVCVGYKGLEQGNDDIYTLLAINNVFGGGMSSRLFQKIREDKGLVYSIYAYPSSYKNSGLYTIYSGMNPEHLDQVMHLMRKEVNTLIRKKISKDELEKSKEQLKGNYILGLEGTGNRMNSIGKSELLLNRIYSPEEVLKKIEDITMERVHNVINSVFSKDSFSISAVGSIEADSDLVKKYK